MKMTVKQAVESQQALQQFGANKYPIMASLTIAANQRILNEVAEKYNERRNELVEKLGKIDPDTKAATVTNANQKKFADEVVKIFNEDLELDLKTVSITDLGGLKKLEIEPNTLVGLEWLLTMEGQAPTKSKRKTH